MYLCGMISKNKMKYIHHLASKKFRMSNNIFVAEGFKIVGDLLSASFVPVYIAATSSWLKGHKEVTKQVVDIDEVTDNELSRISFLDTPQQVLAVFKQPEYDVEVLSLLPNKLSLVLDDVQNPGNMGTIIRLADWFGIENIICSAGCADIYNPKTVQATMGALARVRVSYVDLNVFFTNVRSAYGSSFPIYGTFLDGDNIYDTSLSSEGIIVMGNEGRGVSTLVERYVNSRLYIPNYPLGRTTSESLNVAIATAVVCAEFRRRLL